jgi:hypothetical protein
MSRGPRSIDLGPMYFPIGEEVGAPTPRANLASDSGLFEAYFTGDEPPVAGEGSETPADPVVELASQVETMWWSLQERGSDSGRFADPTQLLPGSEIRLDFDGQTLRIEIHCDGSRDTGWLVARLPEFTRLLHVGLARPVNVSMHDPDGTCCAHYSWGRSL